MPPPEREDLARRLAPVLEASPDVVGAYLFGSRASGHADVDADVDLGIVFDDATPLSRRIELETQLEDALDLRVDLVDLGRANAFLALDAIRGERIFERDGERLDVFDLFVLRRAGDLAPFERARREQLLQENR